MRYGRPLRLQPESYANTETAFHLVVRTHPEVGTLSQQVREALWQAVMRQRDRPEVSLHAAVLMPDHLHVLASPANIDLVRWLGHLKSITTRAAWGAGHSGTIWQRRFYDRALRGPVEFDVAIEYALRNPSAAGLVEDDELWPHRWARWFEA